MSFSKNIDTYPSDYCTILEVIGNEQWVTPIFWGPFKDAKTTIHTRFRFYAFLRLLRKWPSATPEQIEGARRVTVRVTEDNKLQFDDSEASHREIYKQFRELYGTTKRLTDESVGEAELERLMEKQGQSISELDEFLKQGDQAAANPYLKRFKE